jgi:hypothetical protein
VRRAHGVTGFALELLTGQRLDQLVPTHAEVAMDTPDGQRQLVLTEGHVPRHRVLVVGIHQRAIDVEDRRLALAHRTELAPPAGWQTVAVAA